MVAPTIKEPTGSTAGGAQKWGGPDAVHAAQLLKGTHATEKIQESAIENLTTDLTSKAPVNNPTFTGIVAVPSVADVSAAILANNAKVTNAAHTGDATGSGALTISNSAVTNAKMADITQNTIKGRITAGTGAPEDLTAANVRSIINVEDGADVTDAANVNAAGATMNTDTTLVGNSYFKDEDNMASNDATKVASQQSIKSYVDTQNNKIKWKEPVRVATTANITLSGEQTIDGILTSTDRILVKNQTVGAENGIYITAAGAWTRAVDWDGSTEAEGAIVLAREGTANGGKAWKVDTVGTITIGTTAVVISEFGAGGGSGTGFTNLIVKSADETKNNDNILADDLELSVPVVALSVYFFEFILVFDSASLADLKYAFSLPGDAINNKKLASSWQSTGQAATNSTTVAQVITTTPGEKILQGTGVFTTVSAGTFALQWAQNTSDPGNTIMKAGSILKVMKQQ